MSDIIIIQDTPHVFPKATISIKADNTTACCDDNDSGGGSGGVSVHNDLLQIQGGTNTERYHLSKRLYDALQQAGASVSNKFITQDMLDEAIATIDFTDIEAAIAALELMILDLDGPGLVYTTDNKLTLDLESKTLVSPTITPSWSFVKNDDSAYTPSTSSSKSVSVDKGVKASLSATYQYPVPSSTQAAPSTVGGSWGGTLPPPNTPSAVLTINNITTNNGYNVSLSKPKSGLIVENGQVKFPTGNDNTSDSISIVFLDRSYLGYSTSTSLTGTELNALGNSNLVNSKGRTISGVTSTGATYTYYTYPAAFGDLTSIIMDGAAPVIGAFTKLTDTTVINPGGINVLMRVYRSNAVNAFTNNTLAFS